jgi:amino acid adenylation domain-containing protein
LSPLESRREKILSFAGEQLRIPLDIEKGPLYRLYLLKETEQSYFFCFTVHHIIFDGYSRRLFVIELSRIYSTLITGSKCTFGPLEFQSYDFAASESEASSHENEHELIEYWKEYLKDCPPELRFPYDYQRSNNPSSFGCREHFQISGEYSQKLRKFSHESDASVFKTLLSIMGILFNKSTGSTDISIGIPVSNRRSSDLLKIYGFFVDTLPIRLAIDEENNFRMHLSRTNDVFQKSVQNSLPFDKIVEVLKPERISGLNPFFQICFSWINNFTNPMNLGGINGKRITVPNGVSSYDITFYMWENCDNIEGEIEYNTSMLKRETIIRLCDNFLNLIKNLLENPDTSIGSLSMISEEERKLIDDINNTRTDYPSDKTIVQLFEEQVRLYPDKKAVVFKDSSLTYDQVNQKSNQLARALRNSGTKANDTVAILVDKSVDMIVGILGILKAGGAYVPLDPEYPGQRKDFILRDSGCRILVTQDKYIEETAEGLTKVNLNFFLNSHIDTSNLEGTNVSSDLAYIIYTSGTTGLPKGTLITHKGVVRLVRNTNYIDFGPEDRILQAASIVFDSSTEEIFGALLNGATLYVVDKDTILNPDALGDVLLNNNITIADLTSALFAQIAELRTDIFNKLETLIIGGDVVSAPHVNKVRKSNPQLTVIDSYGPTENACNSTAYKIEKDFDYNIPIGKPISNSTAYIFDKYMNYQPIGIIGELYVGGDGVSPGYLNRDDLNSSRFVQHPYLPGERLYKTGDFARWLPDGNIEFHGRIDNQLKIRGFRVELEEIESIISKIQGVIDTVVMPLDKKDKDIRLVAFLNIQKDFAMDAMEILGHLKSNLPSYMIPFGIKLMHGFPLTINGKTDRRALVFEESDFAVTHQQEEVLSTETELKLSKVWSEILRTNVTDRNTLFFESGGNSLLAISLLNRLEEEFGISISYRDLILHSSIADLGKYVDENSGSSESTVDIVHLTDLNNLPLTQSQVRIWLVTRLNPDIPAYIVPFVYRLKGPLKIDVFRRSIDALFSRHHVLFSRFFEREGIPYCVIDKKDVHIEFTDYSDIPIKEAEARIFEFASSDSRSVFDLKNGPLYRLHLNKLSNNEFYFYCAIHHIIFDGWSWKIFIDDFIHIYCDLESEREISLKELIFQQYDFANWEKRKGLLKDETKLIEYWKGQLEGCSSILNLVYDFPRLHNSSGFGDKEKIKFPTRLSSVLRQISKNEGVSLFSVMMTVFGILMHKYSGDLDLNIGTPVANRSHSSFENVIGMFVNTVVIRLQLDQKITFKDLLKRTNEVILDAITNQDLQFEKIVEIVNPERVADANPVFQVAFAWEDNLSVPLDLGEVKGENVFIHGGTSPFDITCSLYENRDNIEGALIYNTDLIRKDTAVHFCENFVTLATNLVSSIDEPVSSVQMISEEEKQKVLSFTDTITPYPKDKTIVQLFEEHVLKNPEKTAVVFHNDSLTYDQLNRKANKLAGRLREKCEIQKENSIGILVDKSLDLIVGILGILKSGGTYVPIDPEYPGQRINYIIKDAGCKVLLTQGKYLNLAVEDVEKLNLNSPGTYKNEESNPENINTSSDLAYIMYTSGTTGGPKGSMIRQKSVVRLVRNTNYINITENDRILLTGAIVFDASTFEIWGALLNGGSLYLVDKEDILDPNKLGEELRRNEITILWLTSALFTYLAESRIEIFGKLKYLLAGGDILSASHINKVRKENPKLKVINGYGPTENTTFSTCFEINKNYEYNIPIGRPISNSTAYIFDNNLNYQPIGVKGELYVGGDGVSRGYLNRDDLNRLSFIEHPYIKGERLYKTGDYARWLSDGNIEFLGRIDNQIKIRGFRIEVEEIEAALSEIAGIVEAVVKPVKVESNDLRLVAFLDVPEGFVIDFNEVSNRISGKLPPYMVPSAYKTVHGFPMTINGKIDRKALTIDLSEMKPEEKPGEVKELTATQQKILTIWQDIIKTKSIGINDNFFYIGGNSLLALKVVDRISKEFDIDLDLIIFFNSPRIQSISEFIDIRINSIKVSEKNDDEVNLGKNDKIIQGKI